MADKIKYKFIDGEYEVPRSFVEFVERRNNREGFENNNASKIFNSTK
jgi:4-hydroxyphenylpyruvate dioxygenase-like putative hemolysin